ncbi:CHD5-like protein-domain-containing protein [Lactarius psammicola]|nr:CHD5-like protein-domain-containing protein [Lactarius psammicola]
MSLILTIFALVFVTELISWVGKSVLLHFAWSTYQRFFNRNAANRQRQLKSEILLKKAELLQTSAQDQFAKWAKLRRSVDKGLGDLEKLSCVFAVTFEPLVVLIVFVLRIDAELNASRTAFSLKFNTTLWTMTTGLQFAIGWWYSRAAVFYLPAAWFGPLTWWLSFPFAPTGSVSCGVWQMACRRVIKIGERVVKELMDSSDSEPATADQSTKVDSTASSDSDSKSTKS